MELLYLYITLIILFSIGIIYGIYITKHDNKVILDDK